MLWLWDSLIWTELCTCICSWAGRRIYIWGFQRHWILRWYTAGIILEEDEIKFCGEVTWSSLIWQFFCFGAHLGSNNWWEQVVVQNWMVTASVKAFGWQRPIGSVSRATREEHECAHPSGQPCHHYLCHLTADQELTSQAWGISYSKCHRDLKWGDFCSVMSKAWKCARVGAGFRGCKWQTHIPGLFLQDQVFSMGFQRQTNRKLWVVERSVMLCCCKKGLGAGIEGTICF